VSAALRGYAQMSHEAADSTHYGEFADRMKKLDAGYNKKEIGILPGLGGGLWEMKNKVFNLTREYKFFKGKVIAVAWAPVGGNDDLGNRLVCGDQSGQVLILNAKKGTRKMGYNLSGPSKFVQAVAVHPKKDFVLSGGMDNMISLYKPEKPDDAAWPFMQGGKTWSGDHPLGHDGMISSLRFHPTNDDEFISTGGDGEIKIWNIGKSEAIQTLYGHTAECGSISFPKDDLSGNMFGTASNDTTCKLWDLRSGKCTHSFHATTAADKLAACDFFPNGNAIAAGGQGEATYMWDIRAVKCIAAFTRKNMKVTSCSFSRSGRALFVSHEDGRVIVWDTLGKQGNQEYVVKFDAHFHPSDKSNPKSAADKESQITACLLKPDGEFLATAAFDGQVKCWGGFVDKT